MINALLLSASKADNTGYLEHAIPLISDFLNSDNLPTDDVSLKVLFVPYAGVSISFDDYTHQVEQALAELPVEIIGIHEFDSPQIAIEQSDVILVGGGNTFSLLSRLYDNDVVEGLKNAVLNGKKYIGWSAGSNIAGLSIKTTNDMPIVMPSTFDALGFVACQLNPHYTDFVPPGHHGETREMRLQEFMVVEPKTPIIGIQEGSALLLQDEKVTLIGNKVGYFFLGGQKEILDVNSNVTPLLESASINAVAQQPE